MSQPCQDTMSIHVRKITDSCRDKDCIEDLRVYLTRCSQNLLDTATNIRVRQADLVCTYIDVEPVAFDRHHYCVDVTFFYRILADATIGGGRPVALHGCAVFAKRAVLCGEDSKAHIFRSDTRIDGPDGITRHYANRPTAVVEVLDPMVLGSKVLDLCDKPRDETCLPVPQGVAALFDDELVLTPERRRLYVSLGQFSIIRLERDAQIVVPVLDYALPTKECCEHPGCAEDPCEMFSRIPFPTKQFTSTGCDDQDCNCNE